MEQREFISKMNWENLNSLLKNEPLQSETIAKLKSIIKENNLIQEEIAFLSFCWMAENVTYAHNELQQRKRIDCSAEGMYKNGKSVCSGFSNLYNYLNTQLGIKTVDIGGYAKGAGYVPGENYNSNHAWNAIKLRNKFGENYDWLGKGGQNGKEWYVSFHGIGRGNELIKVFSILNTNLRQGPKQRFQK